MSARQINNLLLLFLLLMCYLIVNDLAAQNRIDTSMTCYDPIVSTIEVLESEKDPKCHATANRLEDFMFGTPLSFEARQIRMDMQKSLIKAIWQDASDLSSNSSVDINQINEASIKYIRTINSEGKIYLQTIDQKYIPLDGTDLRQYSSIAYSLRAILAVQQDDLFGLYGNHLKAIDENCINQLKTIVDMASMAALILADNRSRMNNEYEVSDEVLSSSWNQVIHRQMLIDRVLPEEDELRDTSLINNILLRKTINQKLQSYQKYNDLSQKLFLRNIQVYFAKKQWPKSETESQLLVNSFQNGLIQFGTELMTFSERLSQQQGEPIIRISHMGRAVHAFLPFEVNNFEDVTYFPLLQRLEQVSIESYDLDAFRDSGLHWQIVQFILDDPSFKIDTELDPFASELLVESIAQFGVLLWRVAGSIADGHGAEYLSNASLIEAMDRIRLLTKQNNGRYGIESQEKLAIASAAEESQQLKTEFLEITDSVGLYFEHRSADWLNRQLRSYVYQSEENKARLSIPPAFGGGGVAAEDIDGDGYDDLLLLSGSGNKIFLNQQGLRYDDHTKQSGLSNQRTDGTYNEPRQPIICDFNNDGHKDIFISYANARHQLYEGRGDGTFTDRSADADLGGAGLVGGPATAADFNNDGLIDLYIGYFGNYIEGELPTLARNNTNGTENVLFWNRGDFKFEKAPQDAGVANLGWTQAVGHTDINNDGWQDLIVGNDFGTNAYYINNGNGSFTDRSKAYNTDKPSYTMNVGIADLNRDQLPDFYISNIVVMEKDDKYVLPNQETTMHFDPQSLSTMRISEANDLFMSKPAKRELTYDQSLLIDRGYAQTGWSWDADFFDYDNDGDEDLYVLNGMNPYSVYGQENAYYQNPKGQSADVLFAKSNAERNVFFRNEGGRLNQHSKDSGLDLLHTSRSATYTDYDLDGDLDVVINNYHGRAYIYENQSQLRSNNWIKIKLSSTDPKVTSDVIGAKILINSKNHKNVWREIHSSDGYLSGHPKTAHIGLGSDQSCKIEVIWPNGHRSKHKLSDVNKTYFIRLDSDGAKMIS